MNDQTKKPTPIILSDEEMENLKKRTTDIPGLIEYAHQAGGFAITPTNEGAIKQKGMMVLKEQSDMKLAQIYEQMQLLAKQAKEVHERVVMSEEIYKAKMSFSPVVGQTYYLYERETKEKFLSMIPPESWKKEKDNFIQTVRLLADSTWEIIK